MVEILSLIFTIASSVGGGAWFLWRGIDKRLTMIDTSIQVITTEFKHIDDKILTQLAQLKENQAELSQMTEKQRMIINEIQGYLNKKFDDFYIRESSKF